MSKSKTKQCQKCKIKFIIEPEDFEFYKKIDVPEPTFCPDCRLQRRFNWRNERRLFKKKDDLTGKEIFSIFSPKADVKIYESDFWWSDKWDAMEYGRDYDFNKSFFEQVKYLIKEVPWPSRPVINLINSDYCMNGGDLKNCYLVFDCGNDENCAYGTQIDYSKDSYDNVNLYKSELCYEGFMLTNCYKTFFSSHCDDCQELIFSHNCVGCSNCFGCTNLRHKKYHIFNKPYTKEEYHKKLEEFNLGSFKNKEELKIEAKEHYLQYPVKFMHGRKNNDVTGNYIYNCKNVKDSYMVKNGEDLRYCYSIRYSPSAKDCYDYSIPGRNSNLVYDSLTVARGINNAKFCYNCFPDCRNFEYCMECSSSSNLFACIGLRKKEYCILNKQYTKEEYNELVPKIKQHMNDMPYIDKKGRTYKYGEFFPTELSPFAYNETIAHEYFPLTKEQALKQGYTWYDKPKPEYQATIKAKQLPDHIKDIDNSILKEVIECKSSDCAGSTVFRIIPSELKFYQKMNLPIPRYCPDCRHKERIKQRNPMKLHHRQCMNPSVDGSGSRCNTEFETTYSPNRKEIVYCEKCYNKEVG